MELSVKELSTVVNAVKVYNELDLKVNRIIIRAAAAAALPETAFFYLKKFKEPEFALEKMYSLGIRVFVVEDLPSDYQTFKNSVFIIVNKVEEAINLYLTEIINRFSGVFVAAISQNNSHNFKDWMYCLLKPLGKIFTTIKYVNELDLIENISQINNSFDYAVCEIPEKYNFPALSLIEKRDEVIFDDEEFKIDYSISESFSQIKLLDFGNNAQYEIQIPFCDETRIYQAVRCLCYLVKCKIYNAEIHNSLFKSLPVPDGLIKMRAADNKIGLISCFSTVNNIYSICKSFDFLARQHQFCGKAAVICNPDFETLDKKEFFNQLFFCATSCGITRLIFIGYYSPVEHGDNVKITKYDTARDFTDNFNIEEFANWGLLFKGKRYEDFADVFDFFNTGNHDTVLEVSLTALKHNLNYYRKLLRPQTKLIAMVKADCYGSGSVEICNMLQNNACDYLCVAFPEEGIALRRANIKLPIMVMNYDGGNYKQLANYNLEPTLFSSERTRKFIEILKLRGIKHYPVHIKLDTGMHRSGFMPEELDTFCALINDNKETLKIVSLYTHFVAADDANEDQFSHVQINRFNTMADKICRLTGLNPMRHICNSVGIERFTDYQYNMVRLGIGLYGVAYEATDKLMGISKWKTNIVQIKTIPPQETVGYNRNGKISCESKIALLPVGYADGLNRKFGNGNLYVEINGKLAPIIGNICMDMCMVNITGIGCKIGDEAVIFDSNTKLIQMAQSIGTIAYEILTGISPRVKRVFVE